MSSGTGGSMLTIYLIQKVLDTAEGESRTGHGGGMLTIYIQKVLDTAEGECPSGQGTVC